jgi:hypothetical protein
LLQPFLRPFFHADATISGGSAKSNGGFPAAKMRRIIEESTAGFGAAPRVRWRPAVDDRLSRPARLPPSADRGPADPPFG